MAYLHRLYILACCLPIAVTLATAQAPTPTPAPCIAIVGDSIAQGGVVVEVPGSGFPVVQTTPFSDILTEQLINVSAAQGYSVADYSVGGIGLGENAYFESDAYEHLQATTCETAILFPWINDLPKDTGADEVSLALEGHIDTLTELMTTLIADTPVQQVLLLNYYYVPDTEMGRMVYETATAPHIITQMNNYLEILCNEWQALDAPVTCLDLATLFAFESDIIMLDLSREIFQTNGYTALNPEQNSYFGNFWAQFPQQALRADGTHLNSKGKQLLAEHIITIVFGTP